MKKTLVIIMIAVFAARVIGATTYDWTNNNEDNDFTNLDNWYEFGTTTVPTSAFTGDDNLRVQLIATDKAVIDSTTAGRQLQIGWEANTAGLVEINAGADVSLSSCVYLGCLASSSVGTLNMTGGALDATASYTAVGGYGEGCLNISGGTLHTNRMTVANKAGSIGELTVSGTGYLKIDDYLKDAAGDCTITMIGADAKIEVYDDLLISLSGTTLKFVLDGADGVGDGIEVAGDVTLADGAEIDLSFLNNFEVYGTYTVISCQGTMMDYSSGNLLSDVSVADGWTYEIVTNGGTTELRVTPAAKVSSVLNDGQGDFDPWNTTRWAPWYSNGKLVETFNIDCNVTFASGYGSSNPWQPNVSEHQTGRMFTLWNIGRGVTVDGSDTFIDIRLSDPTLGTLYNFHSFYDEDDLFPLNYCFYVSQSKHSAIGDTTIKDIWMKGFRVGVHTACATDGISARHPLIIDGCQFRHDRWAMFLKGNGATIQNCGIKRNALGGIYLEYTSYGNTIINNDFQDNNYEQDPLYGDIILDATYGNLIQGNDHQDAVISGTFHCGVKMYRNMGEKGILRENTVCDNVISDNVFDNYSIAYDIGSRESMHRNYDSTIRDLSYEGRSYVQRNIIEENTIVDTTIGMRITGSGNIIQSNDFINVDKPIVLHCAFYNIIENIINDQAGDDVYYWFENSDFCSYFDWFYYGSCYSGDKVINEGIPENQKFIHAYSQYGAPNWPSYSGNAEVRLTPSMIVGSGAYDYGFPDLSGDKYVNIVDYNLLASYWNSSCGPDNNWCMGADYNFDGTVDYNDNDYLLDYWLQSYDMRDCYARTAYSYDAIDIAVGDYWLNNPGDEVAVIFAGPVSIIDSTSYHTIIIYDKNGLEINRCGRSSSAWKSIVSGDFLEEYYDDNQGKYIDLPGDEIAAVSSEATSSGYYPVYIFARGRKDSVAELLIANPYPIRDLAAGDFNTVDSLEEIALVYEPNGPSWIKYIKPADSSWSRSTTDLSGWPHAITGGNFSNNYSGDEIAAITINPNGYYYYRVRYYRPDSSGSFDISALYNTTYLSAISSGNFDPDLGVDLVAVAAEALDDGMCRISYYSTLQDSNDPPYYYADQNSVTTYISALGGAQLSINSIMDKYEKVEGLDYMADYESTVESWGEQLAVLPASKPRGESIPLYWISCDPNDADKKYFRVTPLHR